ncbi:MAG: glycosyltransferase family 4 protein [Gemmatimonadales bacterium]|nr:glycosyltransferase family 4 protein [Gemmatimonadales bacterium]
MPQPTQPHDLLLAYDFPPLGGGIARWMAELAHGYPAGALVVSSGTMPGAEASDASFPNLVDRVGVPAGRLKTAPGLMRWAHRATRLARAPGARFAWVGNLRPAAFPAKWAWERAGLPYGILVHGGDILALAPKLARSRLKREIYRPILADAAVFVANSHWTAERCRALLTSLDLPHEGRVRVVPLGTDPARWHPDAEAGRRFRAARSLPDGRYLLTVARLVPHKGIDTALRVLATLAPQHPDLQYLAVGQGGHEASLRQLAASLGVADRFHLCTDVTDAELPAAYAAADIYLGLSREAGLDVEGFGIALLEAAATALPVVAGRSGGIADAVAEGETGVLVDPLDPQQAVDAVRHLLGDPALARRLGEAGRARVLQYFTWARVVDELRQVAAELGRS